MEETFPATQILAQHVQARQLMWEPRSDEDPELEEWQRMSEIPTAEELQAEYPLHLDLLEEIVHSEDSSKQNLLKKQYYLYRHEGTEMLRWSLNEFRESPCMMESRETYIYTQVHVQGYLFSKVGAVCRLSFSTERSPIEVQWAQSKRLTPGTLVVLSPRGDNFKKRCYVATVAARYLRGGLLPDRHAGEDDNTPPRIEILWSNNTEAILDPSLELIMLEARGGYFEPIRHAMVGLQHAALTETTFDKYFVDADRSEIPARYISRIEDRNVSQPRGLDASQAQAFDLMTSRELAIIQGPPGTGKTYTSLMALKRLIQSSKKMKSPKPIIIAAQTNHALDQLLERCISDDVNIVRLGGRSKVEEVNERTIYNIRQHSKANKNAYTKNATKSQQNHVKRAKKLFDILFPSTIITADHLLEENIITEDQYDSIDSEQWEEEALVRKSRLATTEDAATENIFEWLGGNFVEKDVSHKYTPPSRQIKAIAPGDWEVAQEDDFPDDDEKNRLKGEFLPTKSKYTGRDPEEDPRCVVWQGRAEVLMNQHSDLYDINPKDRKDVYRYLRHRLAKKAKEDFAELLITYEELCRTFKFTRWETDLKIIDDARIDIIGCTTTGLTKYRGLLAAMKPYILLIEEAAETREASVISAIYPSLQQVILVGDHQQLTPHADVPILSKSPYNLHVSLFERLVKNQLPYKMLRVQRRMNPDICDVVRAFYPALEDSSLVKSRQRRPGPPGMSLWWFDHQWPEERSNSNTSHMNIMEAQMILGFVRYLVLSGAKPGQITILSFYNGQVNYIQQLLRRDETLRVVCTGFTDWSVRTVDGYQGEESDVILLSLVRGPQTAQDRANAGFLKNENRVVVATSRARRGMYVFGNSDNLLRDPESWHTWRKVIDVFQKKGCIGPYIPIKCKDHKEKALIKKPRDWNSLQKGCCHGEYEEVGSLPPASSDEPSTSPRSKWVRGVKESDDALKESMKQKLIDAPTSSPIIHDTWIKTIPGGQIGQKQLHHTVHGPDDLEELLGPAEKEGAQGKTVEEIDSEEDLIQFD